MNKKRILQIHNKYQDLGGEDVVVAREKALLEVAGHQVSQYIVSNKELASLSSKIKTAIAMPFSFEHRNRLKRYLQAHKPDVAHVHNFLPMLTPSIFYACKEAGIPVIVTLHNFRLLCSNGLLYRDGKICEQCISKTWSFPAIKYGCYQKSKAKSIFPVLSNALHSSWQTWVKHIDKIIFLTPFSKEIFERSHIQFKPSQIEVKPNFVDDKGYSFEKEDYFLFVGRLSQEKGVLKVIDACIKTNTPLRIAGTGPLAGNIKQKTLEHPYIQYEGLQDESGLQKLYQKAKALITASQMYETFGLVVIEAFSCGTPVIAPDLGTSRTLISPGKNGLLYDPTQASSLEDAIQFFKTTNSLALQKNARTSFEQYFDKNRNLEQLERIYEAAVMNK